MQSGVEARRTRAAALFVAALAIGFVAPASAQDEPSTESPTLDEILRRAEQVPQGEQAIPPQYFIMALQNDMRDCMPEMPEDVIVQVRVRLREDGSLRGQPQATDITAGDISRSVIDAAEDDAVQTVLECARFESLPPEHYATWQVLVFEFRHGWATPGALFSYAQETR